MSQDKSSNRISNFELLRIVAMMLIMISHIFLHGINFEIFNSDYTPAGQMFSEPRLFVSLVITYIGRSFGGIGNVIFILISGFFLIKKEHINVTGQLKKVLIQLLFATIILTVVSLFVINADDRRTSVVDMRAFNSDWWFIGFYILVIVFAELFLNRLVSKIDQKKYVMVLLILFSFVSLGFTRAMLGSLANEFDTFISGIFMYLLGGYIKLYNPFGKIRTWVIILVVIITYVLMTVSYCSFTLGNVHQAIIEQKNDFVQIEFAFYGNYQLPGFVVAISLFELFRRIKMGAVTVINYVSASTFMMYLLHENSLVVGWLTKFKWNEMLFTHNYVKFVGCIFILIIIYIVISIIMYSIYRLIGWLGSRSSVQKILLRNS